MVRVTSDPLTASLDSVMVPGISDAAVAPLVHLVAVTACQCLVFHLLDAGHNLAVGVDTTQ